MNAKRKTIGAEDPAACGMMPAGYADAQKEETEKNERFPGESIARSIGEAAEPWTWECLPASAHDAAMRNGMAMLDVIPPWPAHHHGRLAYAATLVAGIARRNGGWERLDQSLQTLVGADDARWEQIRGEQLIAFVAGALAALGIGVSALAASKLLDNVVRELPRLAWRDPVAIGDPRVAWLRSRLEVVPAGAISSSSVLAAWRAYCARTGLSPLSDASDAKRLGRAMRDAFSDEIRRGVIFPCENITHTQAGEIPRCRGWVGVIWREWLSPGRGGAPLP